MKPMVELVELPQVDVRSEVDLVIATAADSADPAQLVYAMLSNAESVIVVAHVVSVTVVSKLS